MSLRVPAQVERRAAGEKRERERARAARAQNEPPATPTTTVWLRLLRPTDPPCDVTTCPSRSLPVTASRLCFLSGFFACFSAAGGVHRTVEVAGAAMGFYGTLKLIFYKVSADYWRTLIDLSYWGLRCRWFRLSGSCGTGMTRRFSPRNTSGARARARDSACVCVCVIADLTLLIIGY